MAHPALLRNSFVAAVALWVAACTNVHVPDVWVDERGTNFVTLKGVVYNNAKPFSGHAYSLLASGDTASVTPYVNGKIHGIARSWYDNGRMKEHRLFVIGNKTGEHHGWYETGALKFIYHYRNDLHHGNAREWAPDGKLYRNFNYDMGQERGLQQMWESDGRLKANYEVRKGRRYGLAGSSNCLSTM